LESPFGKKTNLKQYKIQNQNYKLAREIHEESIAFTQDQQQNQNTQHTEFHIKIWLAVEQNIE